MWALLRDGEVPDVSPHVRGSFHACGEGLALEDNRKDGHEVVAHLTVAGEGTATFRGAGFRDGLSCAEGKDVSLQVCLGDTGICSTTYSGGRT